MGKFDFRMSAVVTGMMAAFLTMVLPRLTGGGR